MTELNNYGCLIWISLLHPTLETLNYKNYRITINAAVEKSREKRIKKVTIKQETNIRLQKTK